MDLLADLTSWISIGKITLGGILGGYLVWLKNEESINERRNSIRENLSGKEFSIGGDRYLIKQIDYVEEEQSIHYQIKKRIPFLRKFQGRTKLTVCSLGAPTRPYVWAEEDMGEDFSTYLSDVCSENFPEVRVVEPELDPDSFTQISEVRLEVRSVEPTVLSKVVEQIPQFHEYYFENYPGDRRFVPPY